MMKKEFFYNHDLAQTKTSSQVKSKDSFFITKSSFLDKNAPF